MKHRQVEVDRETKYVNNICLGLYSLTKVTNESSEILKSQVAGQRHFELNVG